jgi:hypothetical protein
MLFARTYDAAKAWEGGCRFVKLRNVDEKSDPEYHNPTYPELLADIWEQGEDVILLEHDVVPYEQSIHGDCVLPRAVVRLLVPRRPNDKDQLQSGLYKDQHRVHGGYRRLRPGGARATTMG